MRFAKGLCVAGLSITLLAISVMPAQATAFYGRVTAKPTEVPCQEETAWARLPEMVGTDSLDLPMGPTKKKGKPSILAAGSGGPGNWSTTFPLGNYGPGEIILYAGQSIPVGTVVVVVDDLSNEVTLFITLNTLNEEDGTWCLKEIHAYAGCEPPSAGKNNNLVPGQFPYKVEFNGWANLPTEYVVGPLPIEDCNGGDSPLIALHAVVARCVTVEGEAAPGIGGVYVWFYDGAHLDFAITESDGTFAYHSPKSWRPPGFTGYLGSAGFFRDTLVWVEGPLTAQPQLGSAVAKNNAYFFGGTPLPGYIFVSDDTTAFWYEDAKVLWEGARMNSALGTPPADQVIFCHNIGSGPYPDYDPNAAWNYEGLDFEISY